MSGPDLVLVLRYRKAVTYGFHVLLGALGQHETATRYEVRFGENVEETARYIREAGNTRTLVLWSFYSPDAAALAEELGQIRALADGPNVTHLAGGVHATAEPVQTLDAGWDMAAIGEGESTLLSLVDAKGDPAGITGLAYREATGKLIRTGKAKQRDLDEFRASPCSGTSSTPSRSPAAASTRARSNLDYYMCVRNGMSSPGPRSA